MWEGPYFCACWSGLRTSTFLNQMDWALQTNDNSQDGWQGWQAEALYSSCTSCTWYTITNKHLQGWWKPNLSVSSYVTDALRSTGMRSSGVKINAFGTSCFAPRTWPNVRPAKPRANLNYKFINNASYRFVALVISPIPIPPPSNRRIQNDSECKAVAY